VRATAIVALTALAIAVPEAIRAHEATSTTRPFAFASVQSSPPGADISWTPPAYVNVNAFREQPVTIVTDGRWYLPGTLSLPNGTGPHAAVVLVSGSGPNDADETVGTTKVFKDLAWGLASRGIAVLRYPKRTREYGAGSSTNPAAFTVKDEYVDDAQSAVALLAARPEIDRKRIVLVGHSEGGYLAPRIATGEAQIAAIAILDGNTRPVEQSVIDQLRYLASFGGPNAAALHNELAQVEAQARAIDAPDLKPGTSVRLLSATIPSSYLLDLRGYDPGAVAARLTMPIYVAQGGRDYQVTAADFDRWKTSLAGHANATLKRYPSLDHLLVSGVGPSRPEQYREPGRHVSIELVDDLITWMSGR